MRLSIAVAIGLAVACPAVRAQVRPNATWRQIQSQNFTIIYEAGLDSIARHAAVRAEREHARLSAGLINPPEDRIDIVIADNSDVSNGNARPFPNNRITIWVRPPVEELSLQNYDDWIDLVITHELTHIFHHEPAGRVGRGLRAAFGRVPFPWPFFPVLGTPRWNLEGLATFIESRHTGAGRVQGSYHEMVVRTALLEDAFPGIDRISGETPLWPGGSRAYIYGSLFMDYIARRYGADAHRELIEKTAGSVLPPPWRMDGVAKSALGRSFTDLYRDWRTELERRYRALADTLIAHGITQTERVTTAGRWALYARVAPDNRRLAYADENGRDATATRIVDLRTGDDVRIRRNGLGRMAWLPDDSAFITAQLEFADPYSFFSDLYLVRGGKEERLTYGARAESPDVSPDGTRVVYVQNLNGSNRLVVRDITSGAERVLMERSPDAHWILPRWSPDGDRIAVQRWTGERGHDVVIIDGEGRMLSEIRTSGADGGPAWSRDGRFVIFSSDRTGITNLYAQEPGGELRQVTNVLSGAYYPEVSPDGRWIYFSGYHADGFHIKRIPFDVASWRTPLREAIPAAQRLDTLMKAEPIAPAEVVLAESEDYSALPSLLPKFWLPYADLDSVAGEFIGALTAGEDAVGRHEYFATLAYDFERERVAGNLAYSWAGLGNPVLTLEASRLWDNTGPVRIVDDSGVVIDTANTYEREDRIALTAGLTNRRWRASNLLLLGVEGVVLNRRVVGTARFRDPRDELLGIIAGAAFANYRTPALAISAEDGVRLSATANRRFEIDPLADRDQSYTQLTGAGAAYKSAGGTGFAHNVIAARASVLYRSDLAPGPIDVGGPDDFLPVRGFEEGARVGFSAWSASLEYRMPLALIARGYRLRPLFIDRMRAVFFADAGNASCNDEERATFLSCTGNRGRPTDLLLSAGFEIGANVAVLSFVPIWLRAGIGFPLAGAEKTAQVFVTFAPSF
ncbi:MAG: hypothetical protein ACT443_00435 [Gemmatimonadota bacterium]